MELIKVENDRNFIILLCSESVKFRIKALSGFNGVFSKSPCNHKIALISEEQGYEEVGRQIYYNLLGSLNLVYVFCHAGYLKTHGIQLIKDSPIKSTMVSIEVDPIPVEIVNIQPIILDLTKCGVLEPVLYFVARDFGTCIGQIILPGSSTWSLAYLIQCDDSGRNDPDMVKVCLVDEELTSPTITEPQIDPTTIPIDHKETSVLNNPDYPFCCELSTLIYDLNHLPPDLNVASPLKKVRKVEQLSFFINLLENQKTHGFM